ncbi:outer membrane beta-barrel protein [Mangrovivirga sp. M17]|uniref:Outer membrane beta-barrel protein n=1 Tax=Mangrovivirga halotolerans TaxID=2993936 RepID=A0ABT3RQY9_9BACT|nr:outer membrane beta-barrel protein [Mangrovivirga halotolerans]MCX2744030.1 outer membrane beta-barrel protein [Mangrovivirga halotolerans]
MKGTLILIVFLTISYSSFGQLRLNTYGGYVFQDKVNSYYSNTSYFNGTIQDSFRWGLGLEYHIENRGAIELQYQRQDTNAPTFYRDNSFGSEEQFSDFSLSINWIMLNGTRYFPISDLVEPFVGAGFGLGVFNIENPDNGRSDSATKFSWQIRGGANLWMTPRMALRIQASLISATQAFGGGLYFGTGGVGAGVNNYSTMYQFAFDGGLVFRLGK